MVWLQLLDVLRAGGEARQVVEDKASVVTEGIHPWYNRLGASVSAVSVGEFRRCKLALRKPFQICSRSVFAVSNWLHSAISSSTLATCGVAQRGGGRGIRIPRSPAEGTVF